MTTTRGLLPDALFEGIEGGYVAHLEGMIEELRVALKRATDALEAAPEPWGHSTWVMVQKEKCLEYRQWYNGPRNVLR